MSSNKQGGVDIAVPSSSDEEDDASVTMALDTGDYAEEAGDNANTTVAASSSAEAPEAQRSEAGSLDMHFLQGGMNNIKMIDSGITECDADGKKVKRARTLNFDLMMREIEEEKKRRAAAQETKKSVCSSCTNEVDGTKWDQWIHLGPGGHLAGQTVERWIRDLGLGLWISKDEKEVFEGDYGVYLLLCGNCMMKGSQQISSYNFKHYENTVDDAGEWLSSLDFSSMIARDLMAHQMYEKAKAVTKPLPSSGSNN